MENFIAIGDIHGCIKPLLEILNQIKNFSQHKIIFLGDYIDRGPASNEVIDRIKKIPALFLKGNHEDMLFDLIELSQKKREALSFRKISSDNYDWLKNNCLSFYESKKYIFCHAGLNINKPLKNQKENDYLWSMHRGSYKKITRKLVIHGHFMVKETEINGNNINIDTGCGKNGYLSALILPEMQIIKSQSIGKAVSFF